MFEEASNGEDDTGKRRAKRGSVIIRALVHLPTGKTVERRVRNLSAAGACMDQGGELTAGDELVLDMGTLKDLPARVVWVRNNLAGITFGRPVDLAAARMPRGVAVAVKSGWLADLRDMHR